MTTTNPGQIKPRVRLYIQQIFTCFFSHKNLTFDYYNYLFITTSLRKKKNKHEENIYYIFVFDERVVANHNLVDKLLLHVLRLIKLCFDSRDNIHVRLDVCNFANAPIGRKDRLKQRGVLGYRRNISPVLQGVHVRVCVCVCVCFVPQVSARFRSLLRLLAASCPSSYLLQSASCPSPWAAWLGGQPSEASV